MKLVWAGPPPVMPKELRDRPYITRGSPRGQNRGDQTPSSSIVFRAGPPGPKPTAYAEPRPPAQARDDGTLAHESEATNLDTELSSNPPEKPWELTKDMVMPKNWQTNRETKYHQPTGRPFVYCTNKKCKGMKRSSRWCTAWVDKLSEHPYCISCHKLYPMGKEFEAQYIEWKKNRYDKRQARKQANQDMAEVQAEQAGGRNPGNAPTGDDQPAHEAKPKGRAASKARSRSRLGGRQTLALPTSDQSESLKKNLEHHISRTQTLGTTRVATIPRETKHW